MNNQRKTEIREFLGQQESTKQASRLQQDEKERQEREQLLQEYQSLLSLETSLKTIPWSICFTLCPNGIDLTSLSLSGKLSEEIHQELLPLRRSYIGVGDSFYLNFLSYAFHAKIYPRKKPAHLSDFKKLVRAAGFEVSINPNDERAILRAYNDLRSLKRSEKSKPNKQEERDL